MRIPFGSHEFEHRSAPVSSQTLLNFYPELQPATAKDQFIIRPTPGLATIRSVGDGPIHGMHVMRDVLYVVSGTKLFSINDVYEAVELGEVLGDKRVSIANNGTQLCITNGEYAYIYTVSGGLVRITDAEFRNSSSVVYLDSYFLFVEDGTNNIFASAVLDGTSYNGLDFTPINSFPGDVLAVNTNYKDLIVFTKDSIEIWYNAANRTGFPFSKLNGGLIPKGCRAKNSVQNIDGALVWLASDNAVYILNGYTPTMISDPAVEYAIQKSSNLEDAYSYYYTEESHKFYCLTIPDIEETWCYDLLTGRWHKRGFRVQATNEIIRHRSNAYAYAYNTHFVGDYENNKIYALSNDYYKDDGHLIKRIATSPPIHNSRNKMIMDSLQIDLESGRGLNVGQGSDPRIFLEVSKDGGRTWFLKENASAGKLGEYTHRTRWFNFGSFYDITLRMSISDPIEIVAINAEAKVEKEQW